MNNCSRSLDKRKEKKNRREKTLKEVKIDHLKVDGNSNLDLFTLFNTCTNDMDRHAI